MPCWAHAGSRTPSAGPGIHSAWLKAAVGWVVWLWRRSSQHSLRFLRGLVMKLLPSLSLPPLPLLHSTHDALGSQGREGPHVRRAGPSLCPSLAGNLSSTVARSGGGLQDGPAPGLLACQHRAAPLGPSAKPCLLSPLPHRFLLALTICWETTRSAGGLLMSQRDARLTEQLSGGVGAE